MLRTSRCEAFCSRASRSGPPSGRLASPHVPEGEWRGRAGTRSQLGCSSDSSALGRWSVECLGAVPA